MAKVLIKFNSAFIKEVTLTKIETTFGRKPENDICIDHPTISGFHGKIKKEGSGYTLEDLNSTNGTFINGRRIKTGQLKDRDQIGVAGHIFDFHLEDMASPPIPSVSNPAVNVSIGSEMKKEQPLPSNATPTPKNESGTEAVQGIIRVVAGGVNGQSEIILKDLVTYIGTTDQALVKIKGFMAPSIAAAISKRPDGFFLKAVKAGYPKVNGINIQEQVLLENGALIEVGGTNMVFYRSDAKKVPSATGEL
ncbi:MAG: hypothetical protein KCHDKBKB_02701 [Elusimicrobia bacterium]|nr:hypothetical protein [Elusimicrobiota bacterium]